MASNISNQKPKQTAWTATYNPITQTASWVSDDIVHAVHATLHAYCTGSAGTGICCSSSGDNCMGYTCGKGGLNADCDSNPTNDVN